MPRNWLLKVDFSQAGVGDDIATAYTGSADCPNNGLRGAGGGFEGVNAATDQGVTWGLGDTVDKRRSQPGPDQYSKVLVASVAGAHSPGVMVRCDAGAQDDYLSRPVTHAWREIGEHTGGAWTSLAFNFATVTAPGDTIYLDVEGTRLGAGLNDVEDLTTSDASHSSGDPGAESYSNPGSATGDDWEAGDLADLVGIEIADDADDGYPLELSADTYTGLYTGRIIDAGSEALRWWSVGVDSYESETVTAAELTSTVVGSGEYRWRTALGREASEGFPGADFEIKNDAAIFNDTPGYTNSGRRGVTGSHTRAKVSTRFWISGGWQAWIAGAWVGEKTAEKIQVKIEFDRRALRYQRRVTRVEVAYAS